MATYWPNKQIERTVASGLRALAMAFSPRSSTAAHLRRWA
jgi:hypothetical protein